MRIDLPIFNQRLCSFDMVVKADIVDIAPHLASVATFAVHVTPWRDERPGWRVSNVETGAFVFIGYTTRNKAIEGARARLADKTLPVVSRLMARAARAAKAAP